MSARKPVGGSGEGKRSSADYTAKDELLMSLLASEAIVDSRGFEVLSAETVEELKKVRRGGLSCVFGVSDVGIRSLSYFVYAATDML